MELDIQGGDDAEGLWLPLSQHPAGWGDFLYPNFGEPEQLAAKSLPLVVNELRMRYPNIGFQARLPLSISLCFSHIASDLSS